MPSYLLTWNPTRFTWDDFAKYVSEVEEAGNTEFEWSCGRNTRLRPGDRVFLLRQGPASRGIVGTGTVLGQPYRDERWKDSRSTAESVTMYVPVDWDVLKHEPLVKRTALNQAPFVGVNWNT